MGMGVGVGVGWAVFLYMPFHIVSMSVVLYHNPLISGNDPLRDISENSQGR